MRQIVGLLGTRGAGKDTVAAMLQARGWRRLAFGDAIYLEVAKAFNVSVEFLQRRESKELPQPELALKHCSDPRFVARVLEMDGISYLPTRLKRALQWLTMPLFLLLQRKALTEALNRPRSPRQILQLWGTEYRRELDREDYWRHQIELELLADKDSNIVITDIRDFGEADMLVICFQARLVRINRPGLAGSDDPALMHITERAMLNHPVHLTLLNEEGDVGLTQLQQQVSQAFSATPELLAA